MLPYLLLGVALLFVVLLVVRWFVTADPKTLVLAVKWIGGALAVLVVLYLVLSGRVAQIFWLVIFLPFLVRALRRFRGFGRTRPYDKTPGHDDFVLWVSLPPTSGSRAATLSLALCLGIFI